MFFSYFFKNKTSKRIYFDSASAVPVLELAKTKFSEVSKLVFANASSIHFEGEKTKEYLFEARKKIASFLKVKSSQIYFASSTTEANNIFIKGLVLNYLNNSPHIIYSKSDHSAIVDVVEGLKTFGVETSNVIPNKIGLLRIEDILNQLKSNTKLICFSYVSSELGTVQEVRKIVLEMRKFWDKKVLENKWVAEYPKIFIDATQAAKYENMDVSTLLVDGLSFGASKLGSVAGCAVLYVKNGIKLFPLISGGGQEEGVRSGTENVPAICALAEVLEKSPEPPLNKGGVKSAREKVFELRNYCIQRLRENFRESELEIFGDTKFKYNKFYEHTAPHILLLSLVDMLGEETCLRLDAKGISVSTATACSLLENSGSNFLKSIGEPVKAKETIRISFSENNTKEEVDYYVKTLRYICDKFVVKN